MDIDKDISAEFTYAVDDIRDFGSRNTSFSKTIVIPGSVTNNKLFGHVFEFGSSNFYNSANANVGYNYNASKSAKCVILVDKIQVFKGVLRLLEIIVDNGGVEYECAVFGELGGFISAVGNHKLEDLNFSAYNHTWTVTAIEQSWDKLAVNGNTNTWGDGYFYPLIDYGKVSTNKIDFDVKTIRPALFVREYLKKIIEGSGYTWTCAMFDTDWFKRLIIPNNQAFLSMYSATAFRGNSDVRSYTIGDTFVNLKVTSPSVLGYFTPDVDNSTFTFSNPTPIDVTMNVKINGQVVSGVTNGYIKVYKNLTEIGSQYVGTGGAGGFFNTNISITSVTFSNTDTFTVTFESTTFPFTINITANSLIEVINVSEQLIPVAYGENLDLNAAIPKGILQKDFFASIVKMFNLYVVEDTTKEKHLNITPFIDFYSGSIVDWTYKMDRSKPMKLKPMSELTSRYYSFKYKPDSDFYNENYKKKYNESIGDYVYDSAYEFANETSNVEVIFSGTSMYQYAGTDKIYPAIYKLSNNNTAEDKMDSIIRILSCKKITGVATWNMLNNGVSIWTSDKYGYAGHLNDPASPTLDLSFGAPKEINFNITTYPSANLFNLFWSEYMAEITDKDSKMLTANFKLTDIDIFNLDFGKFVSIDGVLWRVNKIYDYNPMTDDTTKVDLLRVIEITY